MFDTNNDLFGDSSSLLSLEKDSYIIVPAFAEFQDTASTVTYETDKASNVIATIEYTYSDVCVGTCDVIFSDTSPESFDFSSDGTSELQTQVSQNVVFINVKNVFIGIVIIAVIFILILYGLSVINSYSFSPKGQSNKRRRQRAKESRIAVKNAKASAKRQKKLMKQRKKDYKKRKPISSRRTYD